MKNLAKCKIGDKVVVTNLLSSGKSKQRLIDMGIHVGAELVVKKFAPLGDPIEIGLKDFSVALRKSDAQYIIIN